MTSHPIIKDMETKMKKSLDVTHHEFSKVHTGRASTALVEDISVDYYGAPTPIKQLATVSVPEARMIVVHPWDVNAIAEIEKAINKANISVSVNNDGKLLRLNIPPLTNERRDELVKVIKKMAEESKVSIRGIRREANDELKKKEKEIPEDDAFKLHEEIQKVTDKYIKEIDEILKNKEIEVREV